MSRASDSFHGLFTCEFSLRGFSNYSVHIQVHPSIALGHSFQHLEHRFVHKVLHDLVELAIDFLNCVLRPRFNIQFQSSISTAFPNMAPEPDVSVKNLCIICAIENL